MRVAYLNQLIMLDGASGDNGRLVAFAEGMANKLQVGRGRREAPGRGRTRMHVCPARDRQHSCAPACPHCSPTCLPMARRRASTASWTLVRDAARLADVVEALSW